jgi:hypothetical protein
MQHQLVALSLCAFTVISSLDSAKADDVSLHVPRCTAIASAAREVRIVVKIKNSGSKAIRVGRIDPINAGSAELKWWLRTEKGGDRCSERNLRKGRSCEYRIVGFVNYDGTPGASVDVTSSAGTAAMAFILYDPHYHPDFKPSPTCTAP